MKKILFIKTLFLLTLHCMAQNVGIGTGNPNAQLSITGRARIRSWGYNTNSNFLIFDGVNASAISKMGMSDGQHFGLYGNGSWKFLMNVDDGNIGIGNIPAAKLDVDGNFRYRPDFPDYRAVLMSSTNEGDAEWVKPVAFGVSGSNTLSQFTFSNDHLWHKVLFNTIADYNAGFAWQPVNQVFAAPVKGVYLVGLHMQLFQMIAQPQVRIVRNRGGIQTTVFLTSSVSTSKGYSEVESRPFDASCELLLESGDQLWVEVNAGYTNNATFFGDKKFLSFTGRLLFLQ